jgi:hypothetical protein
MRGKEWIGAQVVMSRISRHIIISDFGSFYTCFLLVSRIPNFWTSLQQISSTGVPAVLPQMNINTDAYPQAFRSLQNRFPGGIFAALLLPIHLSMTYPNPPIPRIFVNHSRQRVHFQWVRWVLFHPAQWVLSTKGM